MKILLFAPKFHIEDVFRETGIKFLPGLSGEKKALVAQLQLATIAALTPADVQVDVWDEMVKGPIDDATELENYDVVGVTFMFAITQRRRITEIAEIFRKRGITTVAGGACVSASPEYYYPYFDVIFIGDAELTWPQFITDWQSGNYRKVYRQIRKPDLALSPLPRWDIMDMTAYAMGTVQKTRGCPYNCDFCGVTHFHGSQLRHKPISRVLEEVATLERLGMRQICFSDDNFAANHRYTKALLRELIPLNNSFENPLTFQTQLSIDIAKDEELLELLADANFARFFIGLESPNEASLREVNKIQNYGTNLIEDCHKVQSYGLPILGSVIVGLDNDDINIFDQQFEFLQEAYTPLMNACILHAYPGTNLWNRFQREGRLVNLDYRYDEGQHTLRVITNVIPKNMTRIELILGFMDLLQRSCDWKNFAPRIKSFISGVKRRPEVVQSGTSFADSRGNLLSGSLISSVDDDTRKIIFDIIQHTLKHAPFMLKRVIGLIFQHYCNVALLPELNEAVHKQIEFEKSVDIEPYIDRSEPLISESFKEFYQGIFVDIYDKVYLGLNSKTRVDEALIRVFTDFLTNSGKTSEQFDDHHKIVLYEIVERTVAEENSIFESDKPSIQMEDYGEISEIKKARLAGEILKYVEQELRFTT
ncbi:B12-binding domain-containing radical SAM protein [bacterium]|nr:B12-binding domain-containing radical SAM protein [bacterium]